MQIAEIKGFRLTAALVTFAACFLSAVRLFYIVYSGRIDVHVLMSELLPAAMCLLLCAAVSLQEHPTRTNALLMVCIAVCAVGLFVLLYQNSYLYQNYQNLDDQPPHMDYYKDALWKYYTDMRAYEIRILGRKVQMIRDLLYALSHTAQSLVFPLVVSAYLTGDTFAQVYGKEKGMGSFARKCIMYALVCAVVGTLLNEMNDRSQPGQVVPIGPTVQVILQSALCAATIFTCRRYRNEKA
jgi:hypothetical protein